MLWKMAPRLALLLREGPSTALLAAMQEGFATVSRNMVKAISEACKSVKADLEISYDEEIQEEDILNTRGIPPRGRSGKKLMAKPRSV